MATHFTLDPKLFNQVLELSGERTKKAAENLALKVFIARLGQKKLTELLGKWDRDASFVHKAERSRS